MNISIVGQGSIGSALRSGAEKAANCGADLGFTAVGAGE